MKSFSDILTERVKDKPRYPEFKDASRGWSDDDFIEFLFNCWVNKQVPNPSVMRKFKKK